MTTADYILSFIGLCLGTFAALFPWHVYLHPESYGPPRMTFSRDGVIPREEIIAQELPEDQELYCVTTAMIRYAKAVALASTRDVPAAERESALFDEALARVPDSRYIFNNTCLDILAVAREMMLGEIEYRKGNSDASFAHLRKSVELDDNLPYDEPWG